MGEDVRYRAVCAGCGAGFRVPERGRTYSCKKCGGVVRVVATTSEPPPPPATESVPTCAGCHAVLPRDTRYCPECGRDSFARPGPVGAPTASERKLAAQDLHEARRAIDFVRNVFWMLAAVFASLTILAVFACSDPETPVAEALSTLAVPLVLLVLCLLAVAHVALHPFAWSLGIAALWTVNFVAVVLQGGWPGWIPLVITLALWLSVAPTVRVGRLVQRHPGAYASRALLGVVAGREIGAQELQRLAVRAARKRSGIYAGGAITVVALCVAGVWLGLRPEPLGPALAAFTEAWNRSDVAGVVAFLEPEKAAAERLHLERVQKNRGWTSLPELVPPSLPSHPLGSRQLVTLDLAGRGEVISCDWRLDGTSWVLTRIELPQPPIESAVKAFTEAWNAADPERLTALYQESSRTRFRAYFERLVDKRGWTNGYPQVLSSEELPVDGSSADVWFRTAQDRFRTRWLVLPDDRWALVTLDPPE